MIGELRKVLSAKILVLLLLTRFYRSCNSCRILIFLILILILAFSLFFSIALQFFFIFILKTSKKQQKIMMKALITGVQLKTTSMIFNQTLKWWNCLCRRVSIFTICICTPLSLFDNVGRWIWKHIKTDSKGNSKWISITDISYLSLDKNEFKWNQRKTLYTKMHTISTPCSVYLVILTRIFFSFLWKYACLKKHI